MGGCNACQRVRAGRGGVDDLASRKARLGVEAGMDKPRRLDQYMLQNSHRCPSLRFRRRALTSNRERFEDARHALDQAAAQSRTRCLSLLKLTS